MPKAKPYSGPVEKSVARQLLNSTGHSVDINGQPLLLGDALLAAAEQLKELVAEANSQLEGSEFAKIIAEHLATDLNRRGGAEIAVTDSGTVQLYINYKNHPRSQARKPQRKRKLPLMEELKARAEDLGVGIPSELGIKRTKIVEWLDQVESGETPAPKKAKPKKAKPKKATVQTAEDPPEADDGPMSAGPDETKVSRPLDDVAPPKKRGIVKTSEPAPGPVVVSAEAVADSPTSSPKETKTPKSGADGASKAKGRNMRQLVEDSKDVSIADLLASDPPK
jgi:hypothetical protein